MSTLIKEKSEARESDVKSNIIEQAIWCVESVANVTEMLRRDIEGTCGDGKGGEDKASPSTLSYILTTGDNRIFEHCDRIDAEIIEIQELLFGKILTEEAREKRVEAVELTKPAKLCSALLRFEEVVVSIGKLGKFVFDPSSGNFPLDITSEQGSSSVLAEAPLDGILTELPVELVRQCDIALKVLNQMRTALF